MFVFAFLALYDADKSVIDSGKISSRLPHLLHAALWRGAPHSDEAVAERGEGFPVTCVSGIKTFVEQAPWMGQDASEVQFTDVVQDIVGAGRLEFCPSVCPVYPNDEAKPAFACRLNSSGRIFNDDGTVGRDPQPSCGFEEQRGLGFTGNVQFVDVDTVQNQVERAG
jgi:hypothetical protein